MASLIEELEAREIAARERVQVQEAQIAELSEPALHRVAVSSSAL
ncbi:hypothetical protein ABII15_35830 [Streptomyces sp. HUAS MG91]|uniref:Uncharacterized protein n=1 Tax=Streptomyces tabacisoli TaxID=3156398 RepID=A0AAU8J3A6_9ACTN